MQKYYGSHNIKLSLGGIKATDRHIVRVSQLAYTGVSYTSVGRNDLRNLQKKLLTE